MLKAPSEPEPLMRPGATPVRDFDFAVPGTRSAGSRSSSENMGDAEEIRERDTPASFVEDGKPVLIVFNQLLEYQFSNIAGAVFLRSGRGLFLRDGKVVGTTDRINRWLGDLIGKASDEGFRSVHEWETPIGNCQGNGSWAVIARRLSGNSRFEGLVMMTARCVAASEPMTGRDAVELFCLTPAEGRLAVKLAGGMTLEDIAATQHTRITTLRAQLRSIFAKTGTSRQAQLVAHIWRASAV